MTERLTPPFDLNPLDSLLPALTRRIGQCRPRVRHNGALDSRGERGGYSPSRRELNEIVSGRFLRVGASKTRSKNFSENELRSRGSRGTMVGDREKKNRFLTWSRPPPRRGVAELEPDDVYSRPGNLYFLPRTGGWSGKNSIFSLLDPSPSVVCHRLNNSLCLPVFPSFLGSQWAGITFCGNILRVLGGSTTK